MHDPTRDLDVDLSHETLRTLGFLCQYNADVKLNITSERLHDRVDQVADQAWQKPEYNKRMALADTLTLGMASAGRWGARHLTRFTVATIARGSDVYEDLQMAVTCESLAKRWLHARLKAFGKTDAKTRLRDLYEKLAGSDQLDHEEMRRMALLTSINDVWLESEDTSIEHAARLVFCKIALNGMSWVKHAQGPFFDEFSFYPGIANIVARRMRVMGKNEYFTEHEYDDHFSVGRTTSTGSIGSADIRFQAYRMMAKVDDETRMSQRWIEAEKPREVKYLSEVDDSLDSILGPRDMFFLLSRATPNKFSVRPGRLVRNYTCELDEKRGIVVDIEPSKLVVEMANEFVHHIRV